MEDFRIKGAAAHGEGDCNAIHVMSPICLVCKQQLLGSFIALGAPYFAAVHQKCAHLYSYDGEYPHRHAVAVYQQRGNEIKRLNNE